MARTLRASRQPRSPSTRLFDLNVEKVLEHWTPAEGLREVISNAIDEAALSGTHEPKISRRGEAWVVRDSGRGLRYTHLTQKENREKLAKPDLVIGKFGVGLKDALAVFERRKVTVMIRSRYNDLRLTRAPKPSFGDITTLQVEVAAPSDTHLVGTEIALSGLRDSDVKTAKSYFLRYSKHEVLERHAIGAVLARPEGHLASIYVNGLRVATEPNFLFSYDITATTTQLRKALNRERTNVGRTAYSARVKDILLKASAPAVVDALVDDLGRLTRGQGADETAWTEVAVQACRLLQARDKAIFITGDDLVYRGDAIRNARSDGYRTVIVPEAIARKLKGLTDDNGNPMRDLDFYMEEWNQSFSFEWVDPDSLTEAERAVWETHAELLRRAGKHSEQVKEVRISKTMRLDEHAAEVVGLWEGEHHRIVIKRAQLKRQRDFTGTLLHEVAHASSGAGHGTALFEDAMTALLGIFGAATLAEATFVDKLRAVTKKRASQAPASAKTS
jgi:hypothetical protein